jgi:hypothetical protein
MGSQKVSTARWVANWNEEILRLEIKFGVFKKEGSLAFQSSHSNIMSLQENLSIPTVCYNLSTAILWQENV